MLRELTFIVDTNSYSWARNMKRLLQETCAKISRSEEKRVANEALFNLQKRYRNILTRDKKELPPIPPKPSGKRGKLAKSDAHNLLERLQKYEAAVLLFAKDPYVSFTNNRAERDIKNVQGKAKGIRLFQSKALRSGVLQDIELLQAMANKGYTCAFEI